MSAKSTKRTRADGSADPDAAQWFFYLLRCGDGSLYAGVTTDLERRLAEHRAGKGARYTRGRNPIELAFSEPFPDRSSAQQREAEVRNWPRDRKEALIRD